MAFSLESVMRFLRLSHYQAIPLEEHDVEKAGVPNRRRISPSSIFVAIFAFALGMVVQYGVARHITDDFPHELLWSSSLRPKTSWVKFEGRLMAESVYRGTPSKQIDDAWARYTENSWFDGGAVVLGVSEDDMRASRKTADDEWFNSTVRLEENGGGFMATLEVFHQLHCLNMLRKYSYPEYYPPESFNSGSMLREHLDHCIDMIRQVLMCHADTGLVAFHWVEGSRAAFPDFSTWHSCRDPEDILSWAHAHEAPVKYRITKPEGAIEMPSLS